jgi:TRAP-type C4-dicarboxylate transport system permease small subunit
MRDLIGKLDARGLSAARWSAFCGLVGLVGYAMITIFDVLMRWLFNSPLDGVADTNRLMVAIIIASFFPMAIAERHNVTIRFLGNALGRRVTAWLELFGALLTTSVFVLLAWQLVKYTIDVFENQETTWLLGWPVGPWWSVVTALMIFCIPVQLVVLLVAVRQAYRGGGPADEPAAPGLGY